MSTVVRHRLLGIGFIAILLTLLGGLVAQFNQAFDNSPRVKLEISSAGNQLNANADVKIRGLIVGRVAAQSTLGRHATLTLAINSKDIGLIPSNVEARILPKTLFGEKFVSLVIPANPSPEPLKAGDVIPEDRSQAALEVEQVLNDFFPLLRAVQPEKLNAALTAIATAVQGRGTKLGGNLANVDTYLAGLEPHLGTVEQDLSGLADFASSLNDNADNLLTIARNAAITGRTITTKRDDLAAFLRGSAGFASTGAALLNQDGTRLIALSATAKSILQTVAAYHGILPRSVKQLNSLLDHLANPKTGALSQGPYLSLKLFPVQSQGAYTTANCPRYPGMNGSDCPAAAAAARSGRGTAGADVVSTTAAQVGSPQEKTIVDDILGPILGVDSSQVSDVAGLLFGPILRDTQVGF